MGEPLTVYTGHWKAEKYLALGLLGLVPTALFVQHAAIDYALAAAMILHGHWGMKAIIDDYAHQGKKGRAATPFWTNLSIGVSAFTFATLCYFNYNDVGICGAVRLLWTIT
ncbi:PREDICTED: succinate dehydrogenase [ubiquinone] cytochrome b small subunit A, mitochondrial-like [Priapulus caudatus]|uniref:Succinate dehydrogenase [ubiquinone] cytochrome b small subunit n=1 Tax=Priapulus caudatus TaxID=37621 RepID=A0ABM1FAR0_PRICU|nr:PREDICTED: succinate dehydrogenase [ubiquinone] cytochrome b small subunit A, mitochondrial-like [Priapulus caudatus]